MAALADGSGDAGVQVVNGHGTRSLDYTLPPSVANFVESVVAAVDNGAAVAVRPTLTIRDSAGEVIARKRIGSSIPAGDTGTATFALRETDDDDAIHYDRDEVGDTLNVETTAARTGQADTLEDVGIELHSTGAAGGILLRDDGANGVTLYVTNHGGISLLEELGGGIFAEAKLHGGMIFRSRGGGGIYLEEFDGGGIGLNEDNAGGIFLVQTGAKQGEKITLFSDCWDGVDVAIEMQLGAAGKSLTVLDSTGAPIFRVNENGDLQGKTGKTLTFNL